MPNNASARRVKDKKNKDKKGEESKKTDTLSLPKEDAASVDSGTLSLSSAGKDNSSKDSADGSSLYLSVLGKEQARESSTLSYALSLSLSLPRTKFKETKTGVAFTSRRYAHRLRQDIEACRAGLRPPPK